MPGKISFLGNKHLVFYSDKYGIHILYQVYTVTPQMINHRKWSAGPCMADCGCHKCSGLATNGSSIFLIHTCNKWYIPVASCAWKQTKCLSGLSKPCVDSMVMLSNHLN